MKYYQGSTMLILVNNDYVNLSKQYKNWLIDVK